MAVSEKNSEGKHILLVLFVIFNIVELIIFLKYCHFYTMNLTLFQRRIFMLNRCCAIPGTQMENVENVVCTKANEHWCNFC